MKSTAVMSVINFLSILETIYKRSRRTENLEEKKKYVGSELHSHTSTGYQRAINIRLIMENFVWT